MSNVSVEISGDGGDGGVRITGGADALVPRSGIRVHGDPGGPGSSVHNGRTYGPVKVEMGELSDGDYGLAAVSPSGQLVKLSDLVFGLAAGEGSWSLANANGGGASYNDAWLIDGFLPPDPVVTVNIGETGRCLLILSCHISWSATGSTINTVGGRMSAELSGANTLAANDDWSVGFSDRLILSGGITTTGRIGGIRTSAVSFFEGLNPGPTTFTGKYRQEVTGSLVSFTHPRLVVLPY